MNELIPILSLLGVGGVLTVIVQAMVNRGKTEADTTDVISQAAGRVAQVLSADNDQLRSQILTLTQKVDDLTQKVDTLTQSLAAARSQNAELLRRLEAGHPGQED